MIELFIAFGAGLISFLSPCVLPLIPGYVSFISGQSLQEILKSKQVNFFPLVLFCFGFSTVFIILGASASYLGQTLLQNSEIKDKERYILSYKKFQKNRHQNFGVHLEINFVLIEYILHETQLWHLNL